MEQYRRIRDLWEDHDLTQAAVGAAVEEVQAQQGDSTEIK